MKRIFWIMAILLIWTGSVNAGELKVKVPLSEFEQMQSHLEALEKENKQLQQDVKSLTEKPSEIELGAKIDAISQENDQLKKQIETLAAKSSAEVSSTKGMEAHLDALGRENRKLKRSVTTLKESGTSQRSDRRTARQMYHAADRKTAAHIFK